MAIGYANKQDILNHYGHDLEVVIYGLEIDSVTIECMDCGEVLIDSPDEDEFEYNEEAELS